MVSILEAKRRGVHYFVGASSFCLLGRFKLRDDTYKEIDAKMEKRRVACTLQLSVYRSSPLLNKDFFGKKVDASTAPTSGTESAEYWVQ